MKNQNNHAKKFMDALCRAAEGLESKEDFETIRSTIKCCFAPKRTLKQVLSVHSEGDATIIETFRARGESK